MLDFQPKTSDLFPMCTAAKWIIVGIAVFLAGCSSTPFKAPNDHAKGYIDLKTVKFCGAFPYSDSAKKRYELSPASDRALEIMRQIEEYSGISQDIAICQGKVSNALATTIDGRKIIIYSEDFMNDIDKVSRTVFWQSVYILAHETGHLLYDHRLAEDTATRFKQELQADEFAGFILYRMGASADYSTWIMNTSYLQNDDNLRTHPDRARRANAIDRGWQKGYIQAFTIPVPPPPRFYPESKHDFSPNGYCDCHQLLSHDSIYRFHSDFMDGCELDSMITAGLGMVDYFITDSLVGPMIYRDTMVGVIIDLAKPEYEQELGGMLVHTDLKVRIFQYNRKLNPLFNNHNLYVTELHKPHAEEGFWNYFTTTVKPGQWIKFKVIVENATNIFPTYRFSYFEFIPPPSELNNPIIFSPFSKNIPK
ncbi:M48 family metalloprotease [Chitinophaga rhizosphaerae]|uniref:hypothetical protein n=1 Tax=Chitinophaga rhizosphaerae TaxID=1864947 RepID=UPI000F7FADDE|nr:hypothetical protein [Chitinophaga rhizosphaerae]